MISAALRTGIFYLAALPVTLGFSLGLLSLGLAVSPARRYAWGRYWVAYILYSLRLICGVRWEVRGTPPLAPALCLSRHESVWETFAYHWLFPRTSMVAKRTLMYIPFFNVLMRQCAPITINRDGSLGEILRIRRAGQARLRAGYNMVVFPEGTRMDPGRDIKHYLGGALLAKTTAQQIYFINLNSGDCWPKKSFVITPGLIIVKISAYSPPPEITTRELAAQFESWVKTSRAELTANAPPPL